MIHEINKTEFIEAFSKWHGGDYKNNFSYEGLNALFDYLDEIEEYELDIVGICCNYSEFENLAEIQEQYPDIETVEDLRELTEVIEIPNTERLIIAG
jgi:hypothetical protein|tara:strand:+ start:436 stop:726 length:291 start_codon:yes stop_codon:yes gene_type:complete